MSACSVLSIATDRMMAWRNKALLVVAVGALLLPATAWAFDYKVGDDSGWALGLDYDFWAFFKGPFHAGDTLEFVYPAGSHSVVWVAKEDYDTCTSAGPAFDSGDDRLTLGFSGDFYFICGVQDHCKSGMKLHVTAQ